jgi:PPM family protein phosphatase
MSFALRYAVRSDRGLIRGNNEDSVYAGPRLLAIADGMGGHVGGEVASKVVISSIAYLDDDTPSADLLNALREATESANVHLRDLVAEDPSLEGMGTTLTALLFAGNRLGLLHVGDSRCYLLRGDQLAQITRDDTFVQALVDEGRLTQEEASSHPQRSLLMHALNGGDLEPDLSVREARVGDRYLLCSDGLTDVVSSETVAEALRISTPHGAADRLVELALRSGGPDNVTVIVADVIDDEYGDDVPVVDGAAGLNNGRREVAPTSAAARAAIAAPTQKDADRGGSDRLDDRMASPGPRPRRRKRALVFGLIVLLLLAGGGFGLWRWTQTQFFVGVADDRVAVYQGINASFGPIHLYRLASTSGISVNDLEQVARDKVNDGTLTASSQNAANDIVNRLQQDNLLPACPTPAPTPSPTPTPKPTKPTKTTAKPPPGKTTPPRGAPSKPASKATTARPTTARPTTAPPTTSASTTASSTLEPGRDCRVVS